VRERYRGHVAALEATGVRARPEWVLHRAGEFRRDDDAAIGALLDGAGSGGPLTAAVCANDSVAAAAIGALRRLGRRVPDDVAVTGFGNSFPQLLDALGLTTVAQPWEEMGRAAAEIALRRMLDGRPAPVEEVNMPVQIVVRGSCGAPVLPEKEAAAAP